MFFKNIFIFFIIFVKGLCLPLTITKISRKTQKNGEFPHRFIC